MISVNSGLSRAMIKLWWKIWSVSPASRSSDIVFPFALSPLCGLIGAVQVPCLPCPAWPRGKLAASFPRVSGATPPAFPMAAQAVFSWQGGAEPGHCQARAALRALPGDNGSRLWPGHPAWLRTLSRMIRYLIKGWRAKERQLAYYTGCAVCVYLFVCFNMLHAQTLRSSTSDSPSPPSLSYSFIDFLDLLAYSLGCFFVHLLIIIH